MTAQPGPRQTPTTVTASPQAIRQALGFYKVMAIVAGVALLILVAEMIMRHGMHIENAFTQNWSYIHGFIYMVFAASIANLGFKASWPIVRIVLNMLTGFVPLLPFFAEPRVTRDTEQLIARLEGR